MVCITFSSKALISLAALGCLIQPTVSSGHGAPPRSYELSHRRQASHQDGASQAHSGSPHPKTVEHRIAKGCKEGQKLNDAGECIRSRNEKRRQNGHPCKHGRVRNEAGKCVTPPVDGNSPGQGTTPDQSTTPPNGNPPVDGNSPGQGTPDQSTTPPNGTPPTGSDNSGSTGNVQGSSAECKIASLDDVKNAASCSSVDILSFTVPYGKALVMQFKDGATINVLGNIEFAPAPNKGDGWGGPMAQITGNNIVFNGNNHVWHFHGESYWDTQGSNGGITKPRPAMKIDATGEINGVYLRNQPAQGFSVENDGPLVISGANVDVRDGDQLFNGERLGHNTDGFDVSHSSHLTIKNSAVYNQDDCVAVNSADNFTFEDNTCEGGNGMSIGSIKSGNWVRNAVFRNNRGKNVRNGLRIKTWMGATNAGVQGVVYDGNVLEGVQVWGLAIYQDYLNSQAMGTGKPTGGVKISDVVFTGQTTTVQMADEGPAHDKAAGVHIVCAEGACTDFDLSKLQLLSIGGAKAEDIVGVSSNSVQLSVSGVGNNK